MKEFFKYENSKTPERFVKPKKSSIDAINKLNLEDISKIEMSEKDFEGFSNLEDSSEDFDMFEFKISQTVGHQPTPQKIQNPFKTPMVNQVDTPGTLCIDLSKKFDNCVFNHKVMNSASKKIKDFDSLNYVNFSSSAKKMIPSVPRFDINEKEEKKIIKRNSKDEESQKNNRTLIARVGLGVLSILMILVLLKIFVEINSGGESYKPNTTSFNNGTSGSKKIFI